jgi:hypothetical protein
MGYSGELSLRGSGDLAMSTVTLTGAQLCAVASAPFPCEPDKIIDPEGTGHWLFPGSWVVPDKSGGIIVVTSAANRSASVDERRLWVAQATGATISRAVVAQQSADTLEGAGDMVRAANRSAIGKFVDGLIASPPIFELIPVLPGLIVVVVGGIPFVIPQPPSPPPEWKSGEQLSGIDLLNVAIRFRAAATALDAGSLREEFLAAESRLFEVGAERL